MENKRDDMIEKPQNQEQLIENDDWIFGASGCWSVLDNCFN